MKPKRILKTLAELASELTPQQNRDSWNFWMEQMEELSKPPPAFPLLQGQAVELLKDHERTETKDKM